MHFYLVKWIYIWYNKNRENMEGYDMEEENKVENKPAQESKIQLTKSTLYMLFALVSLALFIIVKVCRNFGVFDTTLAGIMSIIIYGLTFAGMVLTLFGNKKPTIEFWLNLGVLGLALMVL